MKKISFSKAAMQAFVLAVLPLFLLPVFYLTHLTAAQPDLVSGRDYAHSLGWHLLGTAVCVFCCQMLLRSVRAAAFLAFLLTFFFLFWGYLADITGRFLKGFPAWGGWWQLLTVLFVIVVSFFLLKKVTRTRNATPADKSRLPGFLSFVLLVWILIDAVKVLSPVVFPPNSKSQSAPQNSVHAVPANSPDVYFLLLDEFAGTAAVQTLLHYDNHPFDTFLRERGFFVARHGRSNYNATVVSLASILSMNYLDVIRGQMMDAEHFRRAAITIGSSEVVSQFRASGYRIINNSIFNLKHAAARIPELRFPIRDRIFNANNFWHGFVIAESYRHRGNALAASILRWHESSSHDNDETIWQRTKQTISSDRSPRFIYTHLMWLHSVPYSESEDRSPVGMETVPDIPKQETREYVYSLRYADRQLRPFLDGLLRANGGNVVIVLMGDHGKRDITSAPGASADFANYCAVYLPGKDYHQLYDSISAVNVFRAVLNATLQTDYDRLPDSTISVRY